MAIFKDQEEIAILKEAGHRLFLILEKVKKAVLPGVTTKELDNLALSLIREEGDKPAFLNYQPVGSEYPYPATLCVSVNDEIVHGIPGPRVLVEGDIVGLDIGLIRQGVVVDMAATVGVGKVSEKDERLMENTRESLFRGVEEVRVGNRIGDIGYAIESYLKPLGYGIVRDLGGHGVGRRIHEEPFVPNFGRAGSGPRIVEGQVLALEPMVNLGTDDVSLSADGYTYRTRDGKKSAHFEVTVMATIGGPVIITI